MWVKFPPVQGAQAKLTPAVTGCCRALLTLKPRDLLGLRDPRRMEVSKLLVKTKELRSC